MTSPSKPYFKNLDALRFFAAIGVFLLHALNVQIAGSDDPAWMQPLRDFSKTGALGINLLHVMSGFLISLLLLQEEKTLGKFSVVKYYLRRTLRIWPLYLLVITISFFVIPPLMNFFGNDFHETANPLAYYLFWGNFYILKYGYPYSPILAVLWSVSVEEQFYIGWPWLIRLFRKNRWMLFVIVILISISFRIYFRNDGKELFFNTLCIMSDFAIGAFIASIAVNETPFFLRLKKLSRRMIIPIYIIILLMIIFYHPLFDSTFATVIERLILGIGFGWVILDQAYSENRPFNLHRIPGFVWLGKRTYGLYCFHEVGIISAIKIMKAMNCIHSPFQYSVLMPIIAFSITVVLAALSYRFFEKIFLDWKAKFEVVR
ncbi:MAG TPA: acyltransferase [Chitinophagales bacterium]|nr:acyltransferase [Chitinophagales bacterium]